MKMKEYKYRLLVLIHYLPILIFVAALIYLSTELSLFKWIIIVFPIAIIIICVAYMIRQVRVKHILDDHSFRVMISEKVIKEVLYNDIKSITEGKTNLEISYIYKKKIKTHYINSFLIDYREFVSVFMSKIEESECYEDINIIV